jgi:hypothetical protein
MSILTENNPEYRRCERAGLSLYDELGKLGFELSGVGMGVSLDQKHPAIHMLLQHKAAKQNIPSTYKGFEVKIIITGKIKSL